jgi:hypothetical protein
MEETMAAYAGKGELAWGEDGGTAEEKDEPFRYRTSPLASHPCSTWRSRALWSSCSSVQRFSRGRDEGRRRTRNVLLHNFELVRKPLKLVLPGSVIPREGKNGVTSDTGEDHVLEGRGEELSDCGKGKGSQKGRRDMGRRRKRTTILAETRTEKVHGSDLRQAVLVAKEPQDLLDALFSSVFCASSSSPAWSDELKEGKSAHLLIPESGRLLLRHNSSSVVRPKLVTARSSRPRTNVLGRCEELDRFEAGRVVRTDGGHAAARRDQWGKGKWEGGEGGAHDEEKNVGRGADTETSLSADHGRTDVCKKGEKGGRSSGKVGEANGKDEGAHRGRFRGR